MPSNHRFHPHSNSIVQHVVTNCFTQGLNRSLSPHGTLNYLPFSWSFKPYCHWLEKKNTHTGSNHAWALNAIEGLDQHWVVFSSSLLQCSTQDINSWYLTEKNLARSYSKCKGFYGLKVLIYDRHNQIMQ